MSDGETNLGDAEVFVKRVVQTKEILSKQAVKIAKHAEEHEPFINKVTHLLGVLGFGAFCYILGARPQDVPYVYCLFYVTFVPLRWIYYRFKKWHYYLLDFCYYANSIFMVTLLFFPRNEKLFMVCFSFAEGPLAWALIVWRCSLVFNSLDKIVSVLIHLLPGIVFFTIRWWNPAAFAAMHPEGKAARASWPYVEDKSYLWTWLFVVPLVAYTLWQLLYFLVVNVLRRQRLLKDPEVMTSLQGTLEEGTESKQYLVAVEWVTWRSEAPHHVYIASSSLHGGDDGFHSTNLPFLQDAFDLPNTETLRSHLEWWELPP